MTTNLDLARQSGFAPLSEREEHWVGQDGNFQAFAALIRADEREAYRENLLGEKAEPFGYLYSDSLDGDTQYCDSHDYAKSLVAQGYVLTSVYTAEQCAAMLEQARPKRLTEDQFTQLARQCQNNDGTVVYSLFANAIQDALGLEEAQP